MEAIKKSLEELAAKKLEEASEEDRRAAVAMIIGYLSAIDAKQGEKKGA